jgi:hypothetical protein
MDMMDQREVTDREGITWTCIQALSGISDEAAQVKGEEDRYWVGLYSQWWCPIGAGKATGRLADNRLG